MPNVGSVSCWSLSVTVMTTSCGPMILYCAPPRRTLFTSTALRIMLPEAVRDSMEPVVAGACRGGVGVGETVRSVSQAARVAAAMNSATDARRTARESSECREFMGAVLVYRSARFRRLREVARLARIGDANSTRRSHLAVTRAQVTSTLSTADAQL